MGPWVQTMTTTNTRDVAATVEQVKRCVDSGAEIVRITVQGKKEAAACMDIREALFKDGCVGASNKSTRSFGMRFHSFEHVCLGDAACHCIVGSWTE